MRFFRKISKRTKIVLLSIAALLLVIGVVSFYMYRFLPTKIEMYSDKIDENSGHILLKSGRLVWDTGANTTALFKDCEKEKFQITISPVFEYGHKIRFQKVNYSKRIEIDSIVLKNIIYLDIDNQHIAQGLKDYAFGGIVGMNVIKGYNWIVDFEKNTIQNFPKTATCSSVPRFTLRYSNTMTPKTIVFIEGVKMKNILIDSGFDTDIKLPKSEIEKINEIIKPDTVIYGSSNGLFSDSIPNIEYHYKNIKINDVVFDRISIIQSKRRLIGIGFFRKFDRVFWDSKNREVKFYKD